jgi:hypothetical protein
LTDFDDLDPRQWQHAEPRRCLRTDGVAIVARLSSLARLEARRLYSLT